MQTTFDHKPWIPIVGRWALVMTILVLGGYLRFSELNWDEGQWIHPDEGHMRMITAVTTSATAAYAVTSAASDRARSARQLIS